MALARFLAPREFSDFSADMGCPFLDNGCGWLPDRWQKCPLDHRRHERDRGGLVARGRQFSQVELPPPGDERSEEHTSELQSLMRNSYAVFCLKKKKARIQNNAINIDK